MGNKQLLIVSDDFGMAEAINRGITSAMTDGLVRATNFMVPAPWFEGAYSLAIDYNLPVGIHLCLTCDWRYLRWRPLTKAASLVDSDGYFLPRFEALLPNFNPEEAYRECKAQIDFLRRRNWPITHIDSHMLVPCNDVPDELPFVKVVERVADEEGLSYLYRWQNGQFRYFDSFFMLSGRSYDELITWLQNLSAGRHMLMCHCGLACEELANLSPPASSEYAWAQAYRQRDYEIMVSAKTADCLADCGISLISAAEVRD